MAFDAHKNMAVSTVATAPSPATSGTSLVVAAGEGTRFPAVPFNATVWPAGSAPTPANSEIVRVTNRATDTFTITRAQETGAGGPAARTIIVGDQIAATITAKTLTDVEAFAPIEQSTSATGNQNNFDLNGPNVYLLSSGAAPAFSGFTVQGGAPYAGCRALIICLGTTAKVTNQDTNSTAANRVITPSTSGQIIGVNGVMELIYDDTTDRWREVLLDPGAALDHTFAAGDYTAAGSMTWTVASGDVPTDKYQQIDKMLTVWFTANTTTVGGTLNTTLRKTIPGGFTAASGLWQAPIFPFFDNNLSKDVRISINTTESAAYIRLATQDGSNFAAATDTTYAYLHDWTFGID